MLRDYRTENAYGDCTNASRMIITPITPDLELARSGPRSGGLHASDIYNALYQELEPKRFIKGSAPDALRLEAGLAFEEMLEEGLKRRLGGGERPGEFVTEEGIAYNPDLVIFNGSTRVGEIKLTWMSTKEMPTKPGDSFPPKFDKWLTQIKFYCRALDTHEARLYTFFVNGSYHPPRPQLLAWDIEFTRQELEENYTMCLNFARQRGMLP